MESHEAQRLIVEFVLITDFVAGNGRLGVYRNGSSICSPFSQASHRTREQNRRNYKPQ